MGLEDETRDFLVLVLNSIALMLLWMIANVFAGIYLGYAFFEGSPDWKNIVYYIISIVTFILVIRRLRRKWNL